MFYELINHTRVSGMASHIHIDWAYGGRSAPKPWRSRPPGAAAVRRWQDVRWQDGRGRNSRGAPRDGNAGEILRRMLATLGSRMLAATGLRPDGATTGIPVLAVLPAADLWFDLSAIDDPASPFAREMRKVHDELLASHAAAGNPSVLVLAADDADDTATVALALAAVAAATQRVLLLDADLERRALSAIDAETSDAGLVDVAVGRRLLREAISCDRDTDIDLIALVGPQSRRVGRIHDVDIRRAFAQTRRRYDLVVVAAMDHDDPSVGFFGGLVDHILIVAGGEHYDATAAGLWLARRGLDAAKVRGAVLTGAM